ncbi:GntR family transcriptional regulator [Streptomyces malaysiensis]|uniref:GntR family transcriptional regulator n=1 Tax=Streptomyces malaysiensis TaxID=92644 RepID=UPI002B2973AA|nr:GntR family transcriptional regulator [Streptomyces malaysiensis]
MGVFEPLGQQTAPVVVYQRLRRAILDGHLPVGSPLREATIAREFGISRSPLREALHRLEEEGLVEKFPYRGAYVAQVSKKTIAEIARVRILVEPYVVEQALPALRGDQRLVLLENVDALRRASRTGDPVAMVDAHLSFHGMFYEHCGNDLLRDLWLSWQSKLQLFLVADHSAFENPSDMFDVHGAFIDAVLSEDVDGIRAHVVHHIHGAGDSH